MKCKIACALWCLPTVSCSLAATEVLHSVLVQCVVGGQFTLLICFPLNGDKLQDNIPYLRLPSSPTNYCRSSRCRLWIFTAMKLTQLTPVNAARTRLSSCIFVLLRTTNFRFLSIVDTFPFFSIRCQTSGNSTSISSNLRRVISIPPWKSASPAAPGPVAACSELQYDLPTVPNLTVVATGRRRGRHTYGRSECAGLQGL